MKDSDLESEELSEVKSRSSEGESDEESDNSGMEKKPSISIQEKEKSTEDSEPVLELIVNMPEKDRMQAINQLQGAFSEFYRGLCLMENFSKQNSEAVVRILKKYSKNIEMGSTQGKYVHENIMPHCSFDNRRSLKAIMLETEHTFAIAFTKGHRTEAMKTLRIPQPENTELTSVSSALLIGFSVAVSIFIVYTIIMMEPSALRELQPMLILFRGLFLYILMLWGWGVDMYIWTKYKINYAFIFEFNSREHYKYQQILQVAATFTTVWVNVLALMLLAVNPPPGFLWLKFVPSVAFPAALSILFIVVFLWFQYKGGWWLLKTLFNIVTSPLTPVRFKDFYIADQLVSLAVILYDIEYSFCYLFYDIQFPIEHQTCTKSHTWIKPALAMLPNFWRLLQCLRRYYDDKDKSQLINAGKYFSGIIVTVFAFVKNYSNSWFVLWLLAITWATFFGGCWDVIKDWGLGNLKSKFLRNIRLYPLAWYYFAIVTNCIMRLMWTLTISPTVSTSLVYAEFFLAAVEIYRRSQWNIFRLENEQINNIGKFRVLADVPLPLPTEDPWK